AEIVVRDGGVVGVRLVRRGDEDDAAADARRQRAWPESDGGRVDGAAHARQLRDRRPGPDRLDRGERRRRAALRGGDGGEGGGDGNEGERSHGPGSYRARCDAAT